MPLVQILKNNSPARRLSHGYELCAICCYHDLKLIHSLVSREYMIIQEGYSGNRINNPWNIQAVITLTMCQRHFPILARYSFKRFALLMPKHALRVHFWVRSCSVIEKKRVPPLVNIISFPLDVFITTKRSPLTYTLFIEKKNERWCESREVGKEHRTF